MGRLTTESLSYLSFCPGTVDGDAKASRFGAGGGVTPLRSRPSPSRKETVDTSDAREVRVMLLSPPPGARCTVPVVGGSGGGGGGGAGAPPGEGVGVGTAALAGCCFLEGDAEAASRRARLTALSVLANFAGNLEASMTAWLELLARLSLDMPD